MLSLGDLDELASLLIRAHEVSERADCKQVKILVEVAMFELGTLIAQQSLRDPDAGKPDFN